jgi:hypothetical protein
LSLLALCCPSNGSESAARGHPIPKCSIAFPKFNIAAAAADAALCRLSSFHFDWGSAMARRNDHRVDFKAGQLALFGAAAFVLLVCAWTFVS